MDRTSVIFGNEMPKKVIKKAEKSKKKFQKEFGDDSNKIYHLKPVDIEELSFMNVSNLVLSDKQCELPDNAVIIGNIRMGFGHYRISMAIASCAHALGYKPFWFDLTNFDATGSKMIHKQNDMYSKASKISQKSHLFNHFIWEPLNSEGFKKISYNAKDQKNSELLVPLYHDFKKNTPFIATHVWPSQGAVHADMLNVVNAIPDNWPMGLHLSEGAIHTVQTPFAYLGYKTLNKMDKKPLKGIPEDSLKMVGHYVDDELVKNIESDTEKRIKRINNNEPIRILLTVGGAGAGQDLFKKMIEHLIPLVKEKKVSLLINFGDHMNVYKYLSDTIKEFSKLSTCYFNQYKKLEELAGKMDSEVINGIYCIYNENIFEAVYSTNLLMRKVEILATKPSELAYYPVVKIMMRHIGGHEVYGAIHSSEFGDGTFEVSGVKDLNEMVDRLVNDHDLLIHMSNQIVTLKQQGLYNGGYEVVKLAVKGK